MEKNNETSSFQLENGLELRVEPSFCYRHCGETGISSAGTIVQRVVEAPVNLSSQDLSLYKKGRLCLSPQDNYYDLQNHKEEVDHTLSIKDVRRIFVPIVKKLIEYLPNNLVRSYEIFNADISPIDLSQYTADNHFMRFKQTSINRDILLLHSKNISEPKLINQLWAREMPENRYAADKYLGTILSIFFVRPDKFGRIRSFERSATVHCTNCSDNTDLFRNSKAAIMSLSYGYRARILGIPKKIIQEIYSL